MGAVTCSEAGLSGCSGDAATLDPDIAGFEMHSPMSLSDHEPRTQCGKVRGERCWFAEVVCGITNKWRRRPTHRIATGMEIARASGWKERGQSR
ncbi:hypothetical protein XAP412_510064 [Xanthomonas phaseoli pv. phaseoli]|uniref:Uncharacterized protein n=1 Tax=Xanthomonas campestris pv. phaseoli TaxID=317013 RepID=A0ABY1TUN3_XANCH|nr:hypothetical protein XAP6984_560063 [Xanthomonas phaseoli pv. phaseoli]SON87006.1 hypothetical protein XAP412_510064 [Xanthomonas phaseoli pv. phaseoli]